MKKKYTLTDRLITQITGWMAGIIIVALAIWGIFTLWGYFTYIQTNNAQIDEHVNPIISKAGGLIVAVKFEENQLVAKGDTLLIIDNREYILQQQQTEAAIQKTRAQLQLLESNSHALKAEKEIVQAELNRLAALLHSHKLDISYTVITAPYNGRMGRQAVETGQLINAGETLAYIVNNETDKWVVANFKETQISYLHIGDSAKLIADAYPEQTFSGKIISFSPATGSRFSLLPPDNATGNYVKIVQRIPVRIRIDGNKKDLELLKAGMNVNVYIPKKQRHE
ncbi:HlyD family secretion protein [Niastella sp. OAS944]|uniref:HlyD family secretion protein n=1 Tax=Niastella sp. OAS944 TaxID=2664089 RepID=UPI0035C86DFC|nr:multidrug resistance efflux pump [Chitinophagaceae bacterium OAS944]